MISRSCDAKPVKRPKYAYGSNDCAKTIQGPRPSFEMRHLPSLALHLMTSSEPTPSRLATHTASSDSVLIGSQLLRAPHETCHRPLTVAMTSVTRSPLKSPTCSWSSGTSAPATMRRQGSVPPLEMSGRPFAAGVSPVDELEEFVVTSPAVATSGTADDARACRVAERRSGQRCELVCIECGAWRSTGVSPDVRPAWAEAVGHKWWVSLARQQHALAEQIELRSNVESRVKSHWLRRVPPGQLVSVSLVPGEPCLCVCGGRPRGSRCQCWFQPYAAMVRAEHRRSKSRHGIAPGRQGPTPDWL